MSDDGVTKVVLDLDNAEFVEKMKESLGLFDSLGNIEALGALTEQLVGIGLVLGPIIAAILAMKAALEMTEEAEKIKQVEATFEMLAENAGLAANVIKNDLVAAVGGMADSTRILEAANKAMSMLGANAAKMPQIMELARKATAIFGGDVLQNFNNIAAAMENGNVRMLRQYGIIVQTDTAHKEYAKSLGIGVEYLSQAGMKQAVFNAAMEQAQKKFADVDLSITATSNATKNIATSLTEIKETALLAWEALAGPTVRTVVETIATKVSHLADRMKSIFGKGEVQAGAKKRLLEEEIASLTVIIEKNEHALIPLGKWLGLTERQKKHLDDMKTQLAKINEEEERAAALAQHKAQAEGKGASEKPPQINDEKLKAAKLKFEQDILKIKEDALKAEEQLETNAERLHEIRENEISKVAAQSSAKITELKRDGLDKGVINQQQYSTAVVNIQKKMEADIKQIRMKSNEEEVEALKNLEKQTAYTAAGFGNSWRRNSAQAANDIKNFAKLGDMSFHSVGRNASQAFQAMGNGSKSAGEAMKGFLFGTIGDVAIASGEMHLLAGIWPPNPIELAEGAALIALGGALKAVGSSSGSSAPSGGGGSIGAIGGGPASNAGASAGPTPQAAQTKSFTLAVHGNIFETEQTKQRIVDLFRQSADSTDFTFKTIGTA